MTARPAYFESIRDRATKRWVQLEQDPELAAPWHQLFKQVQSPRHIVSELLQNADDAGATEAIIRIEGGTFLFQHDGEDFSEDHFASLCRFGYSNKRALHTIGFRGIGFKSTFSLGKQVELYTPTLSVLFEAKRFTQPHWVDQRPANDGLTTIRVKINDDNRRTELEKNLKEWTKSPISLLFFKNIRRIRIGDDEIHWGSHGTGPVDGSEWLILNNNPAQTFLLARSKPESFPEEALTEIREERMLSAEEDGDFPPCAIEIVLGVEGRLFVVLPTGVETELPFACNAPFIQDPARLKIKDPETSPTNRWLLERAGRLAAEVMTEWLENTASKIEDRAKAYDLMPDVDREASSIEGVCGSIVELAFANVIDGPPLLLTDNGTLQNKGSAIHIPQELHEVWPDEAVSRLLDDQGRDSLSVHISDSNAQKLVNWSMAEELTDSGVLYALLTKHLPQPKSWAHLLALWAYVAPLISGYAYRGSKEALRIVPAQGKKVLYAAEEVVRLGEKRLVPAEEDWQFLGDWLSVINQNWLRYLTEQRRLALESDEDEALGRVNAADTVLKSIGLQEPSNTGKVMAQVASEFFAQETVTLKDAVRIAQIAAKLGAATDSEFRFVTQDRTIRSQSQNIIADEDGSLSELAPDDWAEKHLLHEDYFKTFTSCTREEWYRWIISGQAGLRTFFSLNKTRDSWISRRQIDQIIQVRGYKGEFNPRYRNPGFNLEDWTFDKEIWKHWESLAESDDKIWVKITEQILSAPEWHWSGGLTATISEESSNGHTSRVVRSGLRPSWLVRLADTPCLPDTHGVPRKPSDLLRRTPQTESLMDVEPFVHGRWDVEHSRPLLQLLGVGEVPTGPEKLITRLTILSKADNPPAHEVEKWYRRLDSLLDNCGTEEATTIKQAFATTPLILTESGLWENASGVFLQADEEDAPGAALIRPSVRELTLWAKIGVADRPTADLAIKWLSQLPSGKPVSQEDARRVRSLTTRYPVRVWEECRHWPNLAGAWTPVEEFAYALTMQSLIAWSHLHQWVKQSTADFQKLPTDVTTTPPFSQLPPLAGQIEEKLHGSHQEGLAEEREWMKELGSGLRRIKFEDEEETIRVRQSATQLAKTVWTTSHGLEVIAFIDGKPAGTPRRADAVWLGHTLYAQDRSSARLAKAVAQELGRSFRRPEIVDAIKLCFDRPAEFVKEYLEENFTLIAQHELALEDDELPTEENLGETTGQIAEPEPVTNPEPTEPDEAEAIELEGDHPDDDLPPPEDDDDEDDTVQIPVIRKSRQDKPPIMERFATGKGFQKDNSARFYDNDGNAIVKANGSAFPWEFRTRTGEVAKHYWPREQCLEREPIQLDAEVWSILEKQPDNYALVLSDRAGNPVEVTGTMLRDMQEKRELTLYPSTYRLVYENE